MDTDDSRDIGGDRQQRERKRLVVPRYEEAGLDRQDTQQEPAGNQDGIPALKPGRQKAAADKCKGGKADNFNHKMLCIRQCFSSF